MGPGQVALLARIGSDFGACSVFGRTWANQTACHSSLFEKGKTPCHSLVAISVLQATRVVTSQEGMWRKLDPEHVHESCHRALTVRTCARLHDHGVTMWLGSAATAHIRARACLDADISLCASTALKQHQRP